jgi:hypothetical protein
MLQLHKFGARWKMSEHKKARRGAAGIFFFTNKRFVLFGGACPALYTALRER